jgi:hypothetical protein
MEELFNADSSISNKAYHIAKENGISRKNVRQRYWDYGWDIEKAITKPIEKNPSEWLKWKEIATTTGVCNPLFLQRIRHGMTPEQAATTPVNRYKKHNRVKGSGKYGYVLKP